MYKQTKILFAVQENNKFSINFFSIYTVNNVPSMSMVMPPVQRWSDAGPAGRVRCWQIQCWEPIKGQQKVQGYYKDDPLCPSGYIIYLWFVDGPDAARQHPGLHCGGHPGYGGLEPDAPRHGLPRGRQPARPPAAPQPPPGGQHQAGPLPYLRPRPPSHRDLWQPGQAGHRAQVYHIHLYSTAETQLLDIGWSKWALFCNFRKLTNFCRYGLFLEVKFQKFDNLGA